MRFVDSHLHLDEASLQSVALARASGIRLFTNGVDRRTSAAGLAVAKAHPSEVVAFVGVHPSEVLKVKNTDWVSKAVLGAAGVGEVGLDPKYSPVGSRSAQMAAFQAQLRVAERTSKPVQVHSRGAERECLDALGSYGLKSVLMHWFQDERHLSEVMGRGYMVSLGPSVLYSKRLQRMARECTQSLVLTETDFPVEFGPLGAVRGPSLIPSVVFKLSEVWGRPYEETRAQVCANADLYLSVVSKG